MSKDIGNIKVRDKSKYKLINIFKEALGREPSFSPIYGVGYELRSIQS
jgi:hypothetical protein